MEKRKLLDIGFDSLSHFCWEQGGREISTPLGTPHEKPLLIQVNRPGSNLVTDGLQILAVTLTDTLPLAASGKFSYLPYRSLSWFGIPPAERAQETGVEGSTLRRAASAFDTKGMISLFRPTKEVRQSKKRF